MKKYLITFGIIFSIFMYPNIVFAEIDSEHSTTEELTRGFNFQFSFKNYPPKTYKGLLLLYVKKTNVGYIGIYH